VKQIQKQWLESVPWQSVLSINEALCRAKQSEQKINPKACISVEKMWESAVRKPMTLPEALEVCKKCYEQSPFIFNNGNTFAAIAKTMMEDWLKSLPPVEAQIIRTTVAHYVAGMVGKRELLKVLDHFGSMLMATAPGRASAPASPAPAHPAPAEKPASATGASVASAQPSH
jgi:hypothetical protein